MKKKPDILVILSLLLLIGILVTSMGPSLLKNLDVQAKVNVE